MNKATSRRLTAVYEEDDPSFSNIMGGPHWNIVDRRNEEVCATVWVDSDPAEEGRGTAEEDALLLSAAPDLFRAAHLALEWAASQDEEYLPAWVQRLARAVKKAQKGDRYTVFE